MRPKRCPKHHSGRTTFNIATKNNYLRYCFISQKTHITVGFRATVLEILIFHAPYR